MRAQTKAGARLFVLAATAVLVLGCGGSAGSQSSPTAAATPAPTAGDAQNESSQPAATQDDGATASTGSNPIGGDIGDRSKGSVQAQVTGGLTSSIDLPFGAPAARLLVDGPGTAYLPYTDPVNGTLFMTITDGGLLVQYAGPDQVALTSNGPCDLHLDSLDANGAKGSFTCKGMLLIKADGMGTADMTGTFEGHQ